MSGYDNLGQVSWSYVSLFQVVRLSDYDRLYQFISGCIRLDQFLTGYLMLGNVMSGYVWLGQICSGYMSLIHVRLV
jgi:hypothetical protein